jgi:cytochrome c oxidase cbb3-type subunit IV
MNIDNLIFDARNVITVVSFLTFIGIIWWTFSARRTAAFNEAANLPFADEVQAVEETHV